MPNLINELYDYAHKFESKYNDPIHSDINEMWQDFKEIVQKTIDRNIPSKLISGSKTILANLQQPTPVRYLAKIHKKP